MEFKRGHEYPGLLISFEGGEGSGKSTHLPDLANYLRNMGYTVSCGREPGATNIGEQIRHTLQHSRGNENMDPLTELLLFEASRAQHVAEKIKPALKKGEIYVLDRFHDSTSVYQGAGRRLGADITKILNDIAIQGVVPDLTFIMDVPVKVGLERVRGRGLFDRMENQQLDFYERVRNGYLNLAKDEPERCKVISTETDEREVVQRKLKDIFNEYIRNYNMYYALRSFK